MTTAELALCHARVDNVSCKGSGKSTSKGAICEECKFFPYMHIEKETLNTPFMAQSSWMAENFQILDKVEFSKDHEIPRA